MSDQFWGVNQRTRSLSELKFDVSGHRMVTVTKEGYGYACKYLILLVGVRGIEP